MAEFLMRPGFALKSDHAMPGGGEPDSINIRLSDGLAGVHQTDVAHARSPKWSGGRRRTNDIRNEIIYCS